MKKMISSHGRQLTIMALFMTGITTAHAGDLTVDGHLNINSNLAVSGTSQFGSDVTAFKNLSVDGTSTLRSVHIPFQPACHYSRRIHFSYWSGYDRTNYLYAADNGFLYCEKGALHAMGNNYTAPLIMGGYTSRQPIRWYWYQYGYGQIDSRIYPNYYGEPVWENAAKTNTSKLVYEDAASVSLRGNLTVHGQASISRIQPMGDIAMGIYTNTP